MGAVIAPPGPAVAQIQGLSPLIRLDVFPAQIKSPDNSARFTSDKARVIVTQDALFIFVDSPTGPAIALQTRINDARGSRATGYTVTYDPPPDTATEPPTPRSEVTLEIKPADGCACGSRLRSFTPFQPMRYTAPGPNLT